MTKIYLAFITPVLAASCQTNTSDAYSTGKDLIVSSNFYKNCDNTDLIMNNQIYQISNQTCQGWSVAKCSYFIAQTSYGIQIDRVRVFYIHQDSRLEDGFDLMEYFFSELEAADETSGVEFRGVECAGDDMSVSLVVRRSVDGSPSLYEETINFVFRGEDGSFERLSGGI